MNQETFIKGDKLFHYTKFESALKIINSKTLLFHELKNMNDIHESYRRIMFDLDVDYEEVEKALSEYRQLCLVQDKNPRRGFDIPAMWAHYAEKGDGVCLVFDKEKLLSNLPSNVVCGCVKYVHEYDSDIVVEEKWKGNLSLFFRDKKDDLFFKKSSDWSYEQEFRLIGRNQKDFSFDDSLMAIIMCNVKGYDKGDCVFNTVNKHILDKVKSKEVALLSYGHWDGKPSLVDEKGDDWACYVMSGYEGIDDSPNGRRIVESTNEE